MPDGRRAVLFDDGDVEKFDTDHWDRMIPLPPEQQKGEHTAAYAVLDADGDGMVTEEEIAAYTSNRNLTPR